MIRFIDSFDTSAKSELRAVGKRGFKPVLHDRLQRDEDRLHQFIESVGAPRIFGAVVGNRAFERDGGCAGGEREERVEVDGVPRFGLAARRFSETRRTKRRIRFFRECADALDIGGGVDAVRIDHGRRELVGVPVDHGIHAPTCGEFQERARFRAADVAGCAVVHDVVALGVRITAGIGDALQRQREPRLGHSQVD